jgi:hypothetical protein
MRNEGRKEGEKGEMRLLLVGYMRLYRDVRMPRPNFENSSAAVLSMIICVPCNHSRRVRLYIDAQIRRSASQWRNPVLQRDALFRNGIQEITAHPGLCARRSKASALDERGRKQGQ